MNPDLYDPVIAYIKETQALVKKVVGLESTNYAVSGGAVGEFVLHAALITAIRSSKRIFENG